MKLPCSCFCHRWDRSHRASFAIPFSCIPWQVSSLLLTASELLPLQRRDKVTTVVHKPGVAGQQQWLPWWGHRGLSGGGSGGRNKGWWLWGAWLIVDTNVDNSDLPLTWRNCYRLFPVLWKRYRQWGFHPSGRRSQQMEGHWAQPQKPCQTH